MKKIISIFAASFLISSSAATVVSCGQKYGSLTFVDGEDAANLILNSEIVVNNGFLGDSYSDDREGSKTDYYGVKYSWDSSPGYKLKDSSSIKKYFQETKDLTFNSISLANISGLEFSVKGTMWTRSFDLYLLKVSAVISVDEESNQTVHSSYSILRKTEIIISSI